MMSWVITQYAPPFSSCTSMISSHRRAVRTGSSPESGSSKSTMSGSRTSARGAEDHRDLAVGEAEVEAVEDAVASERLDDVDELDRVVRAVLPLGARVPLVLVGLGLRAALVRHLAGSARPGGRRGRRGLSGRLLAHRLRRAGPARLVVDRLLAGLGGGLLRLGAARHARLRGRRLLLRRPPPPPAPGPL